MLKFIKQHVLFYIKSATIQFFEVGGLSIGALNVSKMDNRNELKTEIYGHKDVLKCPCVLKIVYK